MHFLDLTLPGLADNLALDEALLLQAESGGPEVLRLWQWPHRAVVLGAGGRLAEDVDEAACRADSVTIHRRSSGGGTVLLGPGCLLFGLVLAYERHPALGDVHASYRYILGQLIEALSPLAGDIRQAGTSDLVLGGRKFSGNAQQRKRRHLLHHGTILVDFDLAQLGQYLKHPARQPDYRRQRPHEEFVGNFPAAVLAIEQQLRVHWHAQELNANLPLDLVRQLAAEKYGQQVWVRRR